MFFKVILVYLVISKQVGKFPNPNGPNGKDDKKGADKTKNGKVKENERTLSKDSLSKFRNSDEGRGSRSAEYDIAQGYQSIAGSSQEQNETFYCMAKMIDLKNKSEKSFSGVFGCKLGHLCNKCNSEEIFDDEDNIKPTNLYIPIDFFEEYSRNCRYVLCTSNLSSPRMKTMFLNIVEEEENYINVKIQSPFFISYMLNSNSVSYIMKMDDIGYSMKSLPFNFKPVNIVPSSAELFSRQNDKQLTRGFLNIFRRTDRNHEYGRTLNHFDLNLRKDIFQHETNGHFTLRPTNREDMFFNINYVPFLSCPNNLNFFKKYQETYLKRIENIPEGSKEKFISLYDCILNIGMSKETKTDEIILHLYNILDDIVKKLEEYKSSSFFSNISSIENDLEIFGSDKRILKFLDIHMNGSQKIYFSTFGNFEKCYNSLIVIWEYLFIHEN